MTAVNSLSERIDAELSAAKRRVDQYRAQHVQEYHDRQKRLEHLEQQLDALRTIWEPRLDLLAEKFGKEVNVHPNIEFGRRSATFEFQSNLARIKLRFSVSPDPEVRKLIFTYDLDILPILMKIDSHDELELPLDAINSAELAEWLDERIVAFVQTYVALHENQHYWRGQLVEDPICKVQFPKFAAASKLEHNGKMMYFIDESTLREFQQRQVNPQP